MKIGVPKELKNNENRVALTPAGVMELVSHNHEVFVQKGAGENSGFLDDQYVDAGAIILDQVSEVWACDLVIKDPRTSTIALTNTTVPYIVQITNKGCKQVFQDNLALRLGLNVIDGKIVHRGVAEAHNLPYFPVSNI